MFNRKKIKELEEKIEYSFNRIEALRKELDDRFDAIELEMWQLKNPPKHKIGDKLNGGIVVGFQFRKGEIEDSKNRLCYIPRGYNYTIYNEKIKETSVYKEII